MGINKVTMNTPAGEQTLIDLTGDSVVPETLAKGATAHNAAGDLIEGKMPTETVLFIPQVLSQEEQAQARDNIGVDPAGTANLKLEEAKTYTDGKIKENKVFTITQANFSFQEIVNAFNSGRVVQAMRDDGAVCPLVLVADGEGAVFVATDGTSVHAVIVTTDNQWVEQDKELANADEYYNKSEIDETLETFENDIETILTENFFNKDAVIELLRSKADANHRHYLSEIDDFNEYMVEHNESATAHQNIRNLIPTKISELTNDKGYLTQHQSLAGYATETYVGNTVSTHNTATTSHNDIRELITGLTTRLNTLANSDDTTLDQMNEVVAYIKNNKTLIEGITTNKVNVSDIINNLTTNVSNKPLSAAQGVVLKSLVDGLQSGKLDASALTAAINTALAQAKNSGEFDGEPGNGIKSAVLNADYTLTLTFDDGSTYTTPSIRGATGRRGTGLLPITTAPSSYTTAVNGLTPTYRISLSTVKTQASATEVYAGDTIRYSYYHYPVIYVDASYVYCGARVSVRGATGAAGKDYSFDPTVYGLPVLHLTGDISPIAVSKDNKVTLSYVYGERSGSCTLKGQGATSYKTAQALGDKGKYNYTINFDTAFEAKSGWGAQKKYCLKANFIDHTHSRNIVNATIWGKFTKERAGVPSAISALHHAGAIDGFPIVIMLNGAFHGLYTFNIPKDGWMFGLVEDTSKTQALVGANEHTAATQFKSEVAGDESDFEIEFVSDKNNSAWVNASLNRLINACINSWGGDLDTTVAQYLDWGSAIDYYIFTVLINGTDMTDKNYLLVTLDGTKWYFSAYDMDSTYGLEWDGSTTYRPNTGVTFASHAEVNRVMELIKRFKTNELKARYAELREGRLSVYRFYQEFENFAWAIPSPVLLEDAKRWSAIPGTYVNNIDSILRWIDKRLEVCDKWMDELPAQETPVAPVTVKNWVEYAEDTAAGSLYNGCGYKDDTRLSSSGGVSSSAQTGSVTVGFIPFKVTDVIRMKGAIWKGLKASVDGHYYIMFYNAEKTKIEGTNPDDWAGYMSNSMSVDYDETTGTTTFDVLPGNALANALANVAYFRINAKGKGSDLIITINQEIT